MELKDSSFPREIAPGVHWLAECLYNTYQGRVLHSYNSVYLVEGKDASMLVEAGHPLYLEVTESLIEKVMAAGAPPIKYIFVTHAEPPHAGGLGRLLDRYPDAIACGDVEDLHLVFPEHIDRIQMLEVGDTLDLGERELVVAEAVFRDMDRSLWLFDRRESVLFSGDGFAYSHYHAADQCGLIAEEAPALDLPEMTALFAELAFYWTRFVDLEPHIERLDALIFDELGAKVIAPTHGLPIVDPEGTMPKIREGLRLGSQGSRGEVSVGRKG